LKQRKLMTTYFRTMKNSECVTTKTHGSIWAIPLMGLLLGTTMALFISLPISQTNDSTLGESIFGRLENHQGRNEKQSQSLTGKNTTGHVLN